MSIDRKRKIAPVFRELTEREQARRDAAMRWAEENREAIIAQGRKLLKQLPILQQVFLKLRAERLRQGMTLSQLAEITGISAPSLSRLENPKSSNPTIDTVCRVAKALGKEVRVELADASK